MSFSADNKVGHKHHSSESCFTGKGDGISLVGEYRKARHA